MKVAMIGLGKLGYPVARAMALQGVHVYGYDADPARCRHRVYEEGGVVRDSPQDVFGRFQVMNTVEDAIANAEIVFLAVQTPHSGPEYEGVEPLPAMPAPFSLEYLHKALDEVLHAATAMDALPLLAVISTVLPRNIRETIAPRWPGSIVYNPLFISMGHVIQDFLHPEFVLVGTSSGYPRGDIFDLYSELELADKVRFMTYEEAELTKLCYNTMIGMKICFANTVAQLCHATPHTDCDTVMDTLCEATDRLISSRYLKGGMGDGGGCHPRDQIALDFYATRAGMGMNMFHSLMRHREFHAEAIARGVIHWNQTKGLQVGILGHSFKPDTDDPTGSHAVLVKNILEAQLGHKVLILEDCIDNGGSIDEPCVVLVGCDKPEYHAVWFKPPTVLIDPFGTWRTHEQVQAGEIIYRPIGRRTPDEKAQANVQEEVRCEL